MIPEGGDIMLIPCNAVSLEPLKYEDKTICLELVKNVLYVKQQLHQNPCILHIELKNQSFILKVHYYVQIVIILLFPDM